jgi:hypothetical protein
MKTGTMMAAKIKLSNSSNMIASLNWLNRPEAMLDFVHEVKNEKSNCCG